MASDCPLLGLRMLPSACWEQLSQSQGHYSLTPSLWVLLLLHLAPSTDLLSLADSLLVTVGEFSTSLC